MKNVSDDCGVGDAAGLKLALVVSTYHENVTRSLRLGALDALEEAGAQTAAVTVIEVPGAFEIPLIARHAAASGSFDAVICLGCIIRGQTPHFEYIASSVAHGIMTACQETGIPITFGVLTTNTEDEALARSGDGTSNKGREAALSAVRVANIVATIGK